MSCEEMDSDLDRSLEELDQDIDEVLSQSEQPSEKSEEEEEASEEEGKGQQKHHLKQKKSAYDTLLPPDEDVQSCAPFVVVVQGSPSSGKSSLIRSLTKHYTKQKINEIKGTITVRANKKQRITIIQCNNDIRAMIDLSKIADIVLLMIDGSLGLEMETFQFLSLLKCHGFPHVMGVVTHLDFYRENKQLRKTKKKFKKRFQQEVGGNNKLFYMSKWDNGLYPKLQVAKLARYIGTSNPPPILWRQNHPYVVVDRFQTQKDKQYQPDEEVDVDFYGYIRGCSYRMNGRVHFVGVGDYSIKSMETLTDPCPQYKKAVEPQPELKQDDSSESEESEGENKVGEITKKRKKRKTLAQNERIIYAPLCNLGTLSFEHTTGFVTIPHEYVKFTKREDGSEQQDVEEGVQLIRDLQQVRRTKQQQQVELFEGVELHDNGMDDNHENYDELVEKKRELQQLKNKTSEMIIADPNNSDPYHRLDDLQYLVYESKEPMITHDCSKFHPEVKEHYDLKHLFVTGMQGDALEEIQQESEGKEKVEKIINPNIVKVNINESTNFFQKGSYVKITLEKIKYSDYLRINHKMPLILTRINIGENNYGFIKVRFKRHRWYTNLLKSNDPIIVSSGWRRYQTMINFATQDPNQRLRFLKYTPHHDFCSGIFWGNFSQQNTGCIFTQTIRNDLKKFRIAGSGLVLEINKSFQIMKKIKLIGEPFKIMKNTAFIRGMFNSSIEVANYIGAQIRTVSGIRGQIKKALKEGGNGTFRATFQDKVLMSDIVFCRAWYRIFLERFYNPVLNFGNNRLMKTKYELRLQQGVEVEKKLDSEYKNVDRAPQTFAPMIVPKKLQAKLPFKTLEKVKSDPKSKIMKAEISSVPKILMSQKQRQTAALINRLNTIKNEKQQRTTMKLKEKERIRQAMERPKKQYYDKLKKEEKSKKMANFTKKKKKQERRASLNTD